MIITVNGAMVVAEAEFGTDLSEYKQLLNQLLLEAL